MAMRKKKKREEEKHIWCPSDLGEKMAEQDDEERVVIFSALFVVVYSKLSI